MNVPALNGPLRLLAVTLLILLGGDGGDAQPHQADSGVGWRLLGSEQIDDCPHFVLDGFAVAEGETEVAVQTSTTIGRVCRSFGFSHVVFVEIDRDMLPPTPFDFRMGDGRLGITTLVEVV